MPELRLPPLVVDLNQQQYELYIQEVKGILYQLPTKQCLVTPGSLAQVSEGFEIVSIPQSNGGILIQLRKAPHPQDLATALAAYEVLTENEKAQFKSAANL